MLAQQHPPTVAMAEPSTSGRSAGYDYHTALSSLQARIDQLLELQQQHQEPRSALRDGVRFWRSNWGSVLALLTVYSMSTATVVAAFLSERQKQVGYEAPAGEGRDSGNRAYTSNHTFVHRTCCARQLRRRWSA